MDVEGVVDEVLEIERTIQMDLTNPPVEEGQEVGTVTTETMTVVEEIVDSVVLATEEEPELNESREENSTDSEGSPPVDGPEVTYVVQVNDEGGIMLEEAGVMPTDVDPHTYFPVRLPAGKVKSVENPLVGVKPFPTTRSRKTKPQAILYNDEIDQIYEMLPDGSVNSITSSGEPVSSAIPYTSTMADSMDVIDFEAGILPKDYELMEHVLANAQEVLEIPQSSSGRPSTSRDHTDEPQYDHDYCSYPIYQIDPTRYKGKSKLTIVADTGVAATVERPVTTTDSRSDEFDVMKIQPTLGWDIPAPIVPATRTDQELDVEFKPTPLKSSAEVKPKVVSGITEPDHVINARSRRSQRQQDRIERQEAERIMAENQQMLQREKVLYGGKSPISPASSQTGPVDTSQSAVPLATANAPPITITDEKEEPPAAGSRRSLPRRNRKLPAHLADPNYVNLDEPVLKGYDTKAKTEDDEVADVINEDDPNKLWCICKKPHNNRFMICCDTCEDWFHGKCVGITKAMGSKLDKWICPDCKNKDKSGKVGLQTPVAKISRKSKGGAARRNSGGVKSDDGKSAAVAKKRPSLSVDASLPPPEKLRQRRVTGGSKDSIVLEPPVTPTTGKCIICKTKPTRPNSVFCSDDCVVKHSHEANSSTSTSTPTTTTVTTATSSKLKRSNSKVADKEELENFLTFHVIAPGVAKSTVVVPPKPKDGSIAVKSPMKPIPTESTTNGKPVLNVSTSEKPAAVVVVPSVKRGSEPQTSTGGKRTKLVEAGRLVVPKRSSRPSTSSTSSKAGSTESSRPARKRNSSGGEKVVEKTKKESEADIHAIRQKSREKLTEVFEKRLKELSEAELGEIPVSNTPEQMSMEIEAELYNTYGAANTKYLTKFRSIVFNLSDGKNNFYKKVSMNELSPNQLVKLESHQLASDELTQWRLNESKKELEMIKRSEIDKFQELKNQERIDAELGFESISATTAVGEEARHPGIPHPHGDGKEPIIPAPSISSEIRQLTRSSSSRSSPRRTRSSRHHGYKSETPSKTKEKESKDTQKQDESSKKRESESGHHRTRSSDRKEKDKKNDKVSHKSNDGDKKSDHRSSGSDRRKSTSSSTKHSSSHINHEEKEKENPKVKETTKEKEKGSDRSLRSRDHTLRSSDRKRSHSESENRKDSNSSRNTDKSHGKKEELGLRKKGSGNDATATSIETMTNKSTTDSQDGGNDQEQPSSTIKTPDFATEEPNVTQIAGATEVQKHVLSAKFTMPELGNFNAILYNVSHHSLNGVYFPTSPVPIVGRISPVTVWDYIDKMKKTKEVIILRLAPATPADTEGYMTFFTYFSSRTRLGVLGGISSPLKDVYLVPLDKTSPVNKALLPFHGPGLPRKRAHCLLAVVTRNFVDGQGARRKVSAVGSSEVGSGSPNKRIKLNADIKPGLISSLNLNNSLEGSGRLSRSMAKKRAEETTESGDVNDDDLPYTPWGEEDGNSPNTEVSTPVQPKPTDAVPITDPKIMEQLKDLDAQIQQEQAAIENISMSLSAKVVPLVIPGLDGEFGAETAPLQFFGQLPRQQDDDVKLDESKREDGTEETGVDQIETENVGGVKVQEDDSAPYSPSQLDLEEDEGS